MSGLRSLWAFSLDFYARPNVAPACLLCQDQAGADVNLILFLLWQGRDGVRLRPEEIAAIDTAVGAWREAVVKPLRSVRRILKGQGADELRAAVQAAELEAERLQQEKLAEQARATTGQANSGAAAANLRAYESAIGRELPSQAVDDLLNALAG